MIRFHYPELNVMRKLDEWVGWMVRLLADLRHDKHGLEVTLVHGGKDDSSQHPHGHRCPLPHTHSPQVQHQQTERVWFQWVILPLSLSSDTRRDTSARLTLPQEDHKAPEPRLPDMRGPQGPGGADMSVAVSDSVGRGTSARDCLQANQSCVTEEKSQKVVKLEIFPVLDAIKFPISQHCKCCTCHIKIKKKKYCNIYICLDS